MLLLHGGDSGRQIQQALEIAVGTDQGDVGKYLAFNLLARRSGVGLQYRRRPGHLHGVGHGAGLQLDVDASGGVHQKGNVLADLLLKPFGLHGNLINPWGQFGYSPISALVCLDVSGDTGLALPDGEICVGNDGAGRIGYGSEQSGAHRLGAARNGGRG